MTRQTISDRDWLGAARLGTREAAFKARAKRARGWARIVNVALFAAVLTAIWQERALAPPVHDRMQHMAVSVTAMIGGSETLPAYLTLLDRDD